MLSFCPRLTTTTRLLEHGLILGHVMRRPGATHVSGVWLLLSPEWQFFVLGLSVSLSPTNLQP